MEVKDSQGPPNKLKKKPAEGLPARCGCPESFPHLVFLHLEKLSECKRAAYIRDPGRMIVGEPSRDVGVDVPYIHSF